MHPCFRLTGDDKGIPPPPPLKQGIQGPLRIPIFGPLKGGSLKGICGAEFPSSLWRNYKVGLVLHPFSGG